jgi:hydrogenase-4 component F
MIIAYLVGSILISIGLFFNKNKIINHLLVGLFLCIQVVFCIYECINRDVNEALFFQPDALALLLLTILTIIVIPSFTHSYDYIYKEKDNPSSRGIYYGAMVILVMAVSCAYLSSHIAVTWIFIEITTLSASALIFHRRNSGSIEATWKYIFVCSISLAFVFIGILFLSMALGNAKEESLYYSSLVQLAPILNTFWLKLSFVFIFTGFTAKLGLVPMYTAGIDAKDKAPTPSAALFSTVLMNAGFVGVFRFYIVIAHTSIHQWANTIILISAILSVFVATVYMLKVKNIKRMLAYSSIEHAGILMLGLVAGGIGYYAAILHLVLHSFAKSSFFLQIGHLYKTYRSKNTYQIGNYFQYNVAGTIFILIAFICLAAIPPSGMFVSEFLLFKSLFQAHYLYILIPLMILLTTILWALGKTIFKMMFIPPVDFHEERIEKVSTYETVTQYILLSFVIWLGLFPPAFFTDLINDAIKLLTF